MQVIARRTAHSRPMRHLLDSNLSCESSYRLFRYLLLVRGSLTPDHTPTYTGLRLPIPYHGIYSVIMTSKQREPKHSVGGADRPIQDLFRLKGRTIISAVFFFDLEEE